MSWYYNIPHLQNLEQAHLLTQNKTQQLAGRDKRRLTFQDSAPRCGAPSA